MGTRAAVSELWLHICDLLPDPRDRLLAHCVFVQDLKPQQIVQEHSALWTNERDVSVAIYRIRRRLRNDPGLQQRAAGQD